MYDVPQWLLRLKQLQQQLIQVRQEYDSACSREASWRSRYEAEVAQRQAEVTLAQQTRAALTADLQQLQALLKLELPSPVSLPGLKQELEQFQSVADLKAKLAELMLEQSSLRRKVAYLFQALEAEKAAHAITRKSVSSLAAT
ncbi:MAG TPA: hypothetical protein V6D03_01295, partial [Candidatus Caenarcaniphilales bacterium]